MNEKVLWFGSVPLAIFLTWATERPVQATVPSTEPAVAAEVIAPGLQLAADEDKGRAKEHWTPAERARRKAEGAGAEQAGSDEGTGKSGAGKAGEHWTPSEKARRSGDRQADSVAGALVGPATTPEQHEALAQYYRDKAAYARAEAERHRNMKRTYGTTNFVRKHKMQEHCDKLIAENEALAKQYTELAELHGQEAGAAK